MSTGSGHLTAGHGLTSDTDIMCAADRVGAQVVYQGKNIYLLGGRTEAGEEGGAWQIPAAHFMLNKGWNDKEDGAA